jgi:hypothetical protein
VTLHRSMDGGQPIRAEPITRLAGPQEERRVERAWRMALGTLACPDCDAPVSPGDGALSPADPLQCPVCHHGARVRDFLSLADPVRPARVEVRVVARV